MSRSDLFKYAIGIIVLVGFFALLFLLVFHPIPLPNADILNIVAGALTGSVVTIVGFYFGSSAGSADKAKTISKMLDKSE